MSAASSPSALPRVLYALAAAAWLLLLKSNPITLFLACCAGCVSMPLYRRLRIQARRLRVRAMSIRSDFPRMALIRATRAMPMSCFALGIVACIGVPVAVLALLVSPQIAGGLERLRELRANNFQIPPEWAEQLDRLRAEVAEIFPPLDTMIRDAMGNAESLLASGFGGGDAVTEVLNRGVALLGGTMTALWILFLLATLTIIFAVSGQRISLVATRMFAIPQAMLRRFVAAIRRALQAILMGIILVAAIQGLLCGIGFAVAGVRQPAFWGMLATLAAPIPMVGTTLIWGPLCLSLWFTGKTVAAVGLALWGVVAVAGVDNVLRPLFLRQGIRAPFFVLIIAILCGLASFGSVGLIAGPMLLAFALQAVEEGNRLYVASNPHA